MSEWIEYNGAARQEPEDISDTFDVKSRDGRIYDGLRKGVLAKECWYHIFGDSDIVAYRNIPPSPEPVTPPKQGS